jgi:hypothetical protein
MSNNIYNILGKLNALTPKETPESVAPQKPIYESVEARGSVLEGIGKVESRLARLFAEDKANEDMLAKKDYDGDGKKESPKDEYMGSKDKAIKKSMGKKEVDEAWVQNPRMADKYGDLSDEEVARVNKDWDDEYNLYRTPGGDPKLASKGFDRAQDVHDRLSKVLKQKPNVQEETHGQYLAQKEKEAEQSGKKSFQAFKQTHPVDGKPGVEENKDE